MGELLLGIKVMKNNKAAGHDDILCEQVKHLGPAAKQWLLDLFNSCLRTNKLPKMRRQTKIVTILKPGKDPADPKNFRAISLLGHAYKLFERLILNRLGPITDLQLIPEQAGFRPGKSCTSQLLNLTQFIEDRYKKGFINVTTFVDLSATYDKVNHRILVQKVSKITTDANLTALIQNMLENRCFFVDLRGDRSRWRRQKNGLPQGSVLAPLLFNIYTNNQPIHPSTRSFLNADDLCIASQCQSIAELEKSLTE